MEKHLKLASSVAHALDNQFGVGAFRFGYASLINIIPGVGDILDALLSFYIVWIAIQMRARTMIILQMAWNILVNFLIGLLPFYGDFIYLIRKVNVKNVDLLKKYMAEKNDVGYIVG